MEIPNADTHVAASEDALNELLYERFIERGIDPQAPAMDAEGNPLLVWLEEAGPDDTYIVAVNLEPGRELLPTKVDPEDLTYPVLVFALRRGTGIPEGTEVSFSG